MRSRRGVLQLPPRSLAVLVILAVALSCAVAGAAADRMLLRSGGFTLTVPDTGYHPLSSILRSPTDDERHAMRARLASELNLSTAQAATVDSILNAHTAEFRQLREEIRPRVEQLTHSVRADVEQVLTPEQRTAYRRLVGERTDTDPRAAARGGQ